MSTPTDDTPSRPSVAIAHDYLTQRGGAERVVLAMSRAFPSAPIYTTLYDPCGTFPEFRDLDVRVSALNRYKFFRRHHRAALPLLPFFASSVQVDADVVVASSSGWAHGFQTDGAKLVYCYSPARWLYDPDRYLGAASRVRRTALRALTPFLRGWDRRAAATADRYLAISGVTQGRIHDAYGITAPVVPAPHSVLVGADPPDMSTSRDGYLLLVSRLLPYKNVGPVVQAMVLLPQHRLLVVGSGPQLAELKRMAPENVSFRQELTDAEMADAYRGCVGLVAASHEDFGLTPLEAAAHGKPSAVLRWGGFLDTVVEGATGVFFAEPEPTLIAAAIEELLQRPWELSVLHARAEEFSEASFVRRMQDEVKRLVVEAGRSG